MDTQSVWKDAITDASPEVITQFAQLAPKTLTNASLPDQEGTSRGTGLLLTKKQILDLRKYESVALALPSTLASVKDYLNFGNDAGGGAGLKSEDFLRTFSNTRRHAQQWSPLRESIMLTGTQLRAFAGQIRVYGDAIKEVYSDVKASGLLDKHDVRTLEQLKKLELELGGKFPGLELDPDTVSELDHYLNEIFKKIKGNLSNVEAIKTALTAFDYELREYILPEIKLRVSLIGSSSLSAEVLRLKEQVDERALRIDEKNKEYKAAVEKSIGAAAGMNLAGLAMAIYIGVEAENIRAQRNSLCKEQEQAIEILRQKNQTVGSLGRVKHDLQSLELVAFDANIATQNLLHVWNVMNLYITNSQAAVNDINDALSLRRFMTAFNQVVEPWKQIETDADALIEVFKEADAEYERNYRISTRALLIQSIPGDYPTVDLHVMAESNALMRDGAVRCRALFIKWNYLPPLHDRFTDLVRNVSEGASALSEAAMSTKMAIDTRINRLQGLEKELSETTDAQDIEDIKADIAIELAKVAKLMTQPVRTLDDRLSQINDVFSQRLTLGYIGDLEKDQLRVKADIDQLTAERASRQTQRKVISDAIDALTKGAIEAIGNDVALTLEKVAALGITPPQVAVVMFAIEQMKKTIVQIGESIRLLDMLRERDKLVERIEALGRDINAKQDQLASLKGKVEFLQAIHGIDDQRRRYVAEYQNAVAAFRLFAAQIEADKYMDEQARSSSFFDQAQQFKALLSRLSLPLASY